MTSNARELAQIPSTPSGRRNLIINGAMQVAQRGTTITSANGYTLDRFNFYNASGSGVATVTQETDVPSGSGFANSLKVDITTADTSNTGFQEVTCTQTIEAQNLQHLQYNTASAKELTLSFWVKSNKTGDYVVWFYVEDAGDQYAKSYTINTANTWEKKTISIPAKTSGGGPANDNGAGLAVAFILLAGDNYKSGTMPSDWETLVNTNRYVDQSVNLFDSTSNDWYITGVQLEVGTVATEFEHRSYGEELALCQRYYQIIDLGGSVANRFNTTYANTGSVSIYFPVEMRGDGSFSSLTTLTSRNLYNMATDLNVTSGGITASVNFSRSRAVSLYLGSVGGSLGGGSGDPLIVSGGELLVAFDAEL